MQKIKRFIENEKGKDLLTIFIVILVGIGSFELGRLSKKSEPSGLKIEYTDKNNNQVASVISASEFVNTVQNSNPMTKTFFASSRGTKYYTISCSAGKTIKQENRIYFATGEEAERAGYTLSSGCK